MNRCPKHVVLLEEVITDETFSQPVNVEGYTHFVMYMVAHGVVTSGAVTFLEGVEDPTTRQPYGGTWVTIGSAVTAPTTGTSTATRFTVGAYSLVQARVSTAIGGGGSISIILVATD